jgi:hypothetical protein
MASPTNSPRRRRQPANRAAPAPTTKVARKSQISKKRALDEYQNQLVARPTIPVSNPFSALRIVPKNSATGQLRQAWEVPRPALRPTRARTTPRGQREPQAPAEAIYKAHRALKQKRNTRGVRSRQYVSRHTQDTTKPLALVSVISVPKTEKIIRKVALSARQVWVPKGSRSAPPQVQLN